LPVAGQRETAQFTVKDSMHRIRDRFDSFNCRTELPGQPGHLCMSIPVAEKHGAGALTRLPYSLRVLAEHLLRSEDGVTINRRDIEALGHWAESGTSGHSVAFLPRRILMQDASGLPALADMAALDEESRAARGVGIQPRLPVDVVVDHAVEVDVAARVDAAAINLGYEFARHDKRYAFLKWAARRFDGVRIAPPGVGICHQLNLEVFSTLVSRVDQGAAAEHPVLVGFDSVLGTDSHSTMINGLSVFGWGVGGIEATAAMLGEPTMLRIPEVVGVRMHGSPRPGVQAADIALELTALLREHNVVQRVVEFCGPAVASLSVPDRATIANMAPEYGATMAYFPPDRQTLDYLRLTGRPALDVALAESFLRTQGMYWERTDAEPRFTRVIEFSLDTVRHTVAGPSLPQQRRSLAEVPATVVAGSQPGALPDGAIALAAITSCTNTSNPEALLTAALLARNAVQRGVTVPAWVKTSFTPGSRVASDLLLAAGLQPYLDALGFHVAGYGCATCMGNSGPLLPGVEEAARKQGLDLAAVLSGNRNFEGRVHPAVRAAYLMSPALVVAYALAGRVSVDLTTEPLAFADGLPVCLEDIWPAPAEVRGMLASLAPTAHFEANRLAWQRGTAEWERLPVPEGEVYAWEGPSGHIRRPPFLAPTLRQPLATADIRGALPLLWLGDAITTDHISPVSRILGDSAAAAWLDAQNVSPNAYGSFSGRRLNHEVMLRGGFANPRLRNLLAPGSEGGVTRLLPEGVLMPVHEAAEEYRRRGIPTVILAGRRYGGGSARDWAAKVTRLLDVCAVIAHGFERIHRSNLLAFGVMPIECEHDIGAAWHTGDTIDIEGLPGAIRPGGTVEIVLRSSDGSVDARRFAARCCIDTEAEAEWLCAGGVLSRVLAKIATASPEGVA